MSNPTQSYANHRRGFTLPYAGAGLGILAAACLMGWATFREPNLTNGAVLLLSLASLTAWYCVRAGDLTVQDRLIRAEMYARLERLLGATRRPDFARLTLKQTIALRFASDSELPSLFEAVIAGELSDPDAIKRRVTDWQADHQRV